MESDNANIFITNSFIIGYESHGCQSASRYFAGGGEAERVLAYPIMNSERGLVPWGINFIAELYIIWLRETRATVQLLLRSVKIGRFHIADIGI